MTSAISFIKQPQPHISTLHTKFSGHDRCTHVVRVELNKAGQHLLIAHRPRHSRQEPNKAEGSEREELPVPGWQNGFSIDGLRLPPFRSASGETSGSIQSSKQEGGTQHRSLGNPVLIILCQGRCQMETGLLSASGPGTQPHAGPTKTRGTVHIYLEGLCAGSYLDPKVS